MVNNNTRQAPGHAPATVASTPNLPTNIQIAYEILRAAGPLPGDDLARRLRDRGIVLHAPGLVRRFPGVFCGDGDGRIALLGPPPDPGADDGPVAASPQARIPVAPIDPGTVAVLDTETTGLDPLTDRVWEIGVCWLDGHDDLRLRVELPPGLTPGLATPDDGEPGVSFGDAWERLLAFVAGATALAGHNLLGFDLPLLKAEAKRHDVDPLPALPVCDLLELSLLAEPAREGRRLSELCHAYGVPQAAPHRALDDARATAATMRAILGRIDRTDPSWALVRACLAAGGHPLAGLLPDPEVPADPHSALHSTVDPLAQAAGGRALPSAREAVQQGVRALEGVAGHQRREGQHRMMWAVAEALDGATNLAVEAPTGTGKSLAYLLAAAGRAAASGRPVVVATATKLLQQQLRRDAERLRELGLLPVPFRQLQGIANYVCAREVADAIVEGHEADPLALAVAVRALGPDGTGVWDDVTDVLPRQRNAAYRETRGALRTDSADCERWDCRWARCCPMLARLEGASQRPGVLAVNHALLGSWARLATQGGRPPVASLDGTPDLILDEAHDLEDTLTGAWTEATGEVELAVLLRSLGGRRGAVRSARTAATEFGVELVSVAVLREQRARLRHSLAALRDGAHTLVRELGGEQRAVTLRMGLVGGFPEFRAVRRAAFDAREGLRALRATLVATAAELATTAAGKPPTGRLVRAARQRLEAAIRRLDSAAGLLESLRELPEAHRWVHRIAVEGAEGAGAWRYERVPVQVGADFAREIVGRARSVVLTSATLTVAGSFDFLAGRLGIAIEAGGPPRETFKGLRLPGPFDHAKQAAIILTSHLPLPVPNSEREFVEALAADQVGFLSLSGGRSLVLFAARKRLERVAELVAAQAPALAERGVELLVQGRHGRSEILRRFREEPGTVAYGARAFWQGFDAPGETLSYLVIEKPPYPHPDEPVAAARQRAVADAGGDPFLDYVVPRTAILMAQGFGRLVRSERDRGVAIVADRRMQFASEANHRLLASLPPVEPFYAPDRDSAWSHAIEFVTGSPPDLASALSGPADEVEARLAALRLLPGEDPEAKLRQAAAELFGIADLLPSQLDLMRAVLEGRDAVGVLPTGSGKSLCFQLPALLRPGDEPTVVVSPLVALIKDQLDDLRARRGLRVVQGIVGRTSRAERDAVLGDLVRGRVRLLYVAPERLAQDPVLRRALGRRELGALVVDEAHCVSDWGHDFRPDYRQIPKAVRDLPRTPRLALTATATREVEADIRASLELRDPRVVREPVDRPNLRYRVIRCDGNRARARELMRIVTFMRGAPGIVYTSKRATSEEVTALLRQAEVNARHYHAGMLPQQRDAVQEAFFEGTVQVVVATKAFGLGINKPDIRWVVNYDLPEALDAYVQEAGRAARDPSMIGDCVLLFTGGDMKRRRAFLRPAVIDGDVAHARQVLAAVNAARRRAGDAVFDPEETAEQAGVETDRLHVLVAWLERAGALERQRDCTGRATVLQGFREPPDPAERRRFRDFFAVLGAKPNVSKQVDFHALEDERRLDPDDLERQLIDWSLEGLVSFHPTRRLWRARLTAGTLDEPALRRALGRWRDWERRRLQAIIGYATGAACRRAAITDHFGGGARRCGDLPGQVPCDRCGPESAEWDALPPERVPDPEKLVDVRLVTLQAIAWVSGWKRARAGEHSLKAALLGKEALGPGRRIASGLLDCPQFGMLRHVRQGERRLDEAVDALIAGGLVERLAVERDGRPPYETLVVTGAGRRALGVADA